MTRTWNKRIYVQDLATMLTRTTSKVNLLLNQGSMSLESGQEHAGIGLGSVAQREST